MGAEDEQAPEEEQALVTGRPTTIVYSGDWPPEQAPRGLFKRYEVRGRVCEVIPHILFLRKDDASAEFIHGHYKRAHATRDRFQRVVAAIRIEFDPPGEGDNLKDQEREELRSLERLGAAQARIEGHGCDGELWLYIPQQRLEAHDPFGDTVADALNCDIARVEAVLTRLQQFDPPGLFARDLKECLALQLADRDRLDPAMAAFIDNLDLVAKRDFKALARVCGVDAEDIADMVAELKSLDPKPALAFDGEVAQPVIPDVLMRARPAGGWHIELNPDTLPRVLVNNQYYAEINTKAASKTDRQYITEQYQSANWLVKSLHQRATTILKVAKEIVRQQDAFFLKGVQHLKPLVLRDIADVIDMHESTVSRVTANKYMASPRGIFELKYFFTSSISRSDGGEAFSAEAIKHRIRAMIDGEPPAQILSDDKIVDILRGDGVDIARRTVAKYREAMGIPSSVQRRRQKSVAS